MRLASRKRRSLKERSRVWVRLACGLPIFRRRVVACSRVNLVQDNLTLPTLERLSASGKAGMADKSEEERSIEARFVFDSMYRSNLATSDRFRSSLRSWRWRLRRRENRGMSRSWERPWDGNGRGKSTASQRRGSAPALARWRQVRTATHLEGRSRKRRTRASKVHGRLVRRAISVGAPATLVARERLQSVLWSGCELAVSQPSLESSAFESRFVPWQPGSGSGGGNGGRSPECRGQERARERLRGNVDWEKDVTAIPRAAKWQQCCCGNLLSRLVSNVKCEASICQMASCGVYG